MHPTSVLATVTGRDRPGVVAAFFSALAAHDVEVRDVEQVVIRGRLILTVLLDLRGDTASLRNSVTASSSALGLECEVAIADQGASARPSRTGIRHNVILIGQPLRPGAVSHVAQRIADCGGNIESAAQLSTEPSAALELVVRTADADQLRAVLVQAAGETGIDVAIEAARLRRRAKRLILLNAESTLLGDSVLEPLAARAGIDPDLHSVPVVERVQRLAGVPESALEEAASGLGLVPGAATFVPILRRLGFYVGVVSDSFTAVTDRLGTELELDFSAANELEVENGKLTGRVVGEVIDASGKAAVLRRFAEKFGVPLSQTVAVGYGIEDTELLAVAGLGIAFNARSAVRSSAETASETGHLDSLLFVLGIPSEEIAEAGAAR